MQINYTWHENVLRMMDLLIAKTNTDVRENLNNNLERKLSLACYGTACKSADAYNSAVKHVFYATKLPHIAVIQGAVSSKLKTYAKEIYT